MHIASLIFIIKISLVDDQTYRYPICLCGGKKTVDEDGVGLRVANSDQKKSLVKVGCYDVALFGKVGRFADDIVLAVFYLVYQGRALLVEGDMHPVTHSHRVGAADAFQSEVALDFALNNWSLVGFDEVPAPCIFDDKSSQGLQPFILS